MLFDKSKMEIYRAENKTVSQPCTVRFDDDEITVEYLSKGQTRTYRGQALGEGHYELSGDGFYGRATMHRFEGNKIFEGTLIEEEMQGMWLISLG